jgi:hypothetical protein
VRIVQIFGVAAANNVLRGCFARAQSVRAGVIAYEASRLLFFNFRIFRAFIRIGSWKFLIGLKKQWAASHSMRRERSF